LTTRSRVLRRAYLFTFLISLLILFSSNTHAVEFVVDATGDAVDTNPGDGACTTRGGFCSLRAAVQETNALSGSDVINLPEGVFPLSGAASDEDKAERGDLDILDDLVIRGAGAGLTRITGSNNLSGIFAILKNDLNQSPTVSIEELAMAEGLENIDGGVVYTQGELNLRNVAIEDGGFKNSAVYAKDTSLTIDGSIFERNNISVSVLRSQLSVTNSQFNNSQFTSAAPISIVRSVAQFDNNAFNANQGSGFAGAISASGSNALIANSTFTGNSSASSGSGAINLNTGTYSLKNNVFSGNTSARTGGAISSNAAMFIANNRFEGNVSGRFGGAIELSSFNRVTITDSLFDSNTSAEDCGAISIQRNRNAETLSIENSIFRKNTSGDVGGAICFDSNVTISHSEFTSNVSRTNGGAIYSFGNGSSIVNSTISGNLAEFGTAIYQKTSADARLDLRHVTINDNASSADHCRQRCIGYSL